MSSRRTWFALRAPISSIRWWRTTIRNLPNLKVVGTDWVAPPQLRGDIEGYEPLFLGTQVLLDTYWPQAEVHLARVVDKAMCGEMDTKDLYDAVKAGRMYCLVFKNDAGELPDVALVFVLELIAYPKLTAMNITAMGGRHLAAFRDRYWKHLCSWAYMNGVRTLQAMVSPAMARVLKSYDFEPVYTVLRKPLTEM